jgi:hypothetical protein
VVRDFIAASGSDQFDIGSIARAKRLHSGALNAGGACSLDQAATAEGFTYASVGSGDEKVHSKSSIGRARLPDGY